MAELKIIARYTDGRMVRGVTSNFWPTKKVFHVAAPTGGGGAPPQEIALEQLKAVFIVKSFEGNADREERKSFTPGVPVSGQRLRVRFSDGEVMLGSSMTYDPTALGFFLFPADTESNNDRVFVVNAAVAAVEKL